MTPRERAEASVLVRQQGPRVVDVQSDTNIVLMRSYSVLDAEVRAGWLRDMVERAIIADRAEQAAGEAERVREAVAAEREACAVLCETWTDVYPGASYARGCAARIRARATSAPAAAPHPASREACEAARAERAQGCDIYADGEGRCEVVPAVAPVASAERAVVEAAEAWRDGLTTATDDESNTLIAAVDALAAARKGGG